MHAPRYTLAEIDRLAEQAAEEVIALLRADDPNDVPEVIRNLPAKVMKTLYSLGWSAGFQTAVGLLSPDRN